MLHVSRFTFQEKGFATIVGVIAVLALSLIFGGGFLYATISSTRSLTNEINSEQGYYASEAGIEDAIYRIKNGKNIGMQTVIPVGSAVATTTIATVGQTKTITTEGALSNAVRKVQTDLTLSTDVADFYYGVQIGAGGLNLKQNSTVNGSIYSDGNITCSSNCTGTKIVGDAWVAGAGAAVLNQSSTTHNADFFAGTTVGSIITSVDTAGDVGMYDSLALGADGFARISYYDNTNKDLKFVRCTNADCSAKNITSVETSNDVGQYSSLAMGADGFARISYYDNTNKDLKFVQCTNADCSTKNITSVETSNDIGQYSSLAMGADGFARISYYNTTNNDLKFARCTNADCSAKNITSVDTSGDVGKYASIKLGADTFPRISYYGVSNTELKLVQCTNADCSTKNIVTAENAADVGQYTSLALGADGFARISYYDNTNKDLKFIKCTDDACSPYAVQSDAAQSFQPSTSSALSKVSVYVKKTGAPPDATIRIVNNNSGVPGGTGSVVATGTLGAASVGTGYVWIDVGFSSNPTLTNGTTYWIVLDGGSDLSNYWAWGYDTADPYGSGQAKYSPDWSAGSPTWTNVNGSSNSDMAFKVYLAGATTKIDGVLVTGDAHVHSIMNAQVCGDAYYTTIDSSSLTFLNGPGSPCPTPYTPGTAYTPYADPPSVPMAISQANIDSWEASAAAGGTIAGPYSPPDGTTLGPVKITGDLNLTTNGATYYINGPVWVVGDITVDNNVKVVLSPGFGVLSTMVIADDPANPTTKGAISVQNGVKICGSAGYNAGTNQCNPSNGSYIMFLSTYSGSGNAIALKNNSDGAIFYASAGKIEVEQTASAKQITGYAVELENNASITYESGLQGINFSAGPSAGWKIEHWKEVP
ncbi:hypothetical protein HY839_00500 [Candidatus Azambacteria bacterium]|nr:hypothetical protein [Candidatus Azambacteria bacterium]